MSKARRRAAVSGIVTALRFGARSYGPSLMPRSAIDQGLVTAGSTLGGFIAGASVSLVLDTLPRSVSRAVLRLGGLGAAGSRAVDLVGSDAPTAPLEASTLGGWADAGLDIAAGITVARLVTSKRPIAAKATATTGVLISVAVDANDAIAGRTDTPDGKYLQTSIGTAAAAHAAIALATGTVRLGGVVAKRFGRTPPARTALSVTGSALVAATGYVAIRVAMARAFTKIADGNRATEVAYSTPPESKTVSGGPSSGIAFSTLGLQGRRFVSSLSTAAQIEAVTSMAATANPVRAYVGVDSFSNIDQRVDAAIAELEQLGGFDRSIIVVACPAGTGYVNYIPVEAVEYMTRGDCATVAVQYGSLPSMLSLNRLGFAADTYRALLERLRTEIAERDLDTALVGYGESLGALAGQAGTLAAATNGDLPIDRALWVGTPKGSTLFESLTGEGTPVFDSPDDLDGVDRPVSLLNHRNDPVTLTSIEDLVRVPTWMEPTDRGRGTNPNQRWFPLVSLVQGLIDTKNAATVVPGQFMSTGHDYRADLASLVRSAYGFTHVGDDELATIDAALRTSEVERSEAMALGRIHSA